MMIPDESMRAAAANVMLEKALAAANKAVNGTGLHDHAKRMQQHSDNCLRIAAAIEAEDTFPFAVTPEGNIVHGNF